MDGVMVANFRVQTELSAVASTADGLTLVLGTADGCVSALSIVDSLYPESAKRLENLPSRDPEVSINKFVIKYFYYLYIYLIYFILHSGRKNKGKLKRMLDLKQQ